MSKVLATIGITGKIGQANVILINNCQQFCFALLGANLVDRVGRRPLLLFSNIGCCLVWLAMTISTATYQSSIPSGEGSDAVGTNSAAGIVCLVFIFIFGAVYSIGFTPLQALYPVEVLSFEMRAKGMGFSGMATAAGKLPLYSTPRKSLTECHSWTPESIRMARFNGQDRLAHVHHLHHLVRSPIRHHLPMDPRDQEPDCKFPTHISKLFPYLETVVLTTI